MGENRETYDIKFKGSIFFKKGIVTKKYAGKELGIFTRCCKCG
ncbi:hypothetical protein [Cytobacillus dafuensis]|nr:hypothetical protein [Cytobacillus dafuensis]